MRCAVVDANGTVSFVTDGKALPALLGGCATNPKSLELLLYSTAPYFGSLREQVLDGPARFDERSANGPYRLPKGRGLVP